METQHEMKYSEKTRRNGTFSTKLEVEIRLCSHVYRNDINRGNGGSRETYHAPDIDSRQAFDNFIPRIREVETSKQIECFDVS